MYELRRSVRVLLYKKKLLKKQHVYRKKKLSIDYYSDVIIQTNKLFLFTTCTGGQIKAFSFLFCAAKDTKSTKAGER